MAYSAMSEVVTGGFFVVGGLLALGRQSLLEPASAHYPKAPAWLRNCMLAFSALQIFVGLQTIMAHQHEVKPMLLLGVGLCLYNLAMLMNLLRQRYPEAVWNRLNQINERLSCSQPTIARWFSK